LCLALVCEWGIRYGVVLWLSVSHQFVSRCVFRNRLMREIMPCLGVADENDGWRHDFC
jgi:hypothetical protein